jgi:hypothetical protein
LWNTVDNAVGYRLQVSTESTFATTVVDDSTLAVGADSLILPLTDGTVYYWRVNARNSAGTGAWSTLRTFTTATLISSAVAGVWKGDTTVDKQGTPTDSFGVVLTIQSSGAYELYRTKTVHASSTALPDTSTELGTCTVSGDTIILIPRTCTAYSSSSGIIEPCLCAPLFPRHVLKSTIVNNTWVLSIADWQDVDITITYVTQKQ